MAERGALTRDKFKVVISRSCNSHDVAEEIRCAKYRGITTRAGFDGEGWTLARLDLMADRHRCRPRVTDTDEPQVGHPVPRHRLTKPHDPASL